MGEYELEIRHAFPSHAISRQTPIIVEKQYVFRKKTCDISAEKKTNVARVWQKFYVLR